MKKKAVALLLVAAMGVSVLAGCGDSGNSGGKGNAASVADAVVDESGKVNGLMYEKGLPLVDEGTYTLTIYCDDSS